MRLNDTETGVRSGTDGVAPPPMAHVEVVRLRSTQVSSSIRFNEVVDRISVVLYVCGALLDDL